MGLSGQQILHPSITKTRITPAHHITGAAGALGVVLQRSRAACTAVAPGKHPKHTCNLALSGVSRDPLRWPKSEPGLPCAFCGLPEH